MSLVYCIEYLIESIAQTQHEISKNPTARSAQKPSTTRISNHHIIAVKTNPKNRDKKN